MANRNAGFPVTFAYQMSNPSCSLRDIYISQIAFPKFRCDWVTAILNLEEDGKQTHLTQDAKRKLRRKSSKAWKNYLQREAFWLYLSIPRFLCSILLQVSLGFEINYWSISPHIDKQVLNRVFFTAATRKLFHVV